MVKAPPADRLPLFPASWYWFGPTRALRYRPVSRDLLGRRLVAFRTASSRVAVLDGRCAHLGADLGEGSVVGETLQCAFHNWCYGTDGRCTVAPAAPSPPPFARLHCYPAVERHGHLFFFNGTEPPFPLPFFEGADPAGYAVARPFHLHGECPWYMVNGNSFDVQHFRACHDRELIGEPVVDCPHPFARRIRLSSKVVGDSIYDRLLRRFVGDRVEVSMTNWGGAIVVVTADFRRTRSTLITFIEPLTEQTCVQHVLVHAPRSRLGAAVNVPRQFLRRLFTRGFMAEEFDTLAGIRYVPASFVPCDRPMVEFFQWIARLPQTAVEQPVEAVVRSEPVSLCEEPVS